MKKILSIFMASAIAALSFTSCDIIGEEGLQMGGNAQVCFGFGNQSGSISFDFCVGAGTPYGADQAGWQAGFGDMVMGSTLTYPDLDMLTQFQTGQQLEILGYWAPNPYSLTTNNGVGSLSGIYFPEIGKFYMSPVDLQNPVELNQQLDWDFATGMVWQYGYTIPVSLKIEKEYTPGGYMYNIYAVEML